MVHSPATLSIHFGIRNLTVSSLNIMREQRPRLLLGPGFTALGLDNLQTYLPAQRDSQLVKSQV